jgi:hypothetical protein
MRTKKETRIKACKRRKDVKDCCFKLPQKKIHTHIYYYHKKKQQIMLFSSFFCSLLIWEKRLRMTSLVT